LYSINTPATDEPAKVTQPSSPTTNPAPSVIVSSSTVAVGASPGDKLSVTSSSYPITPLSPNHRRGIIDHTLIGFFAPLMPVLTMWELMDVLWNIGVVLDLNNTTPLTNTAAAGTNALGVTVIGAVAGGLGGYDVEKSAAAKFVDVLETSDDKTMALLLNLMISSLENAEHERELILLYNIVAEFAQRFPEITNVAYQRILPRMLHAVSTSHIIQVQDAIQKILYRISSNPDSSGSGAGDESPSSNVSSVTNLAVTSSSGMLTVGGSQHSAGDSSPTSFSGSSTIGRSLTMRSMRKKDKQPSSVSSPLATSSAINTSTGSNLPAASSGAPSVTSQNQLSSVVGPIVIGPNHGFPALQNADCGNFIAVSRNAKYNAAGLVASLVDAILKLYTILSTLVLYRVFLSQSFPSCR
jgi:hypothetical protein